MRPSLSLLNRLIPAQFYRGGTSRGLLLHAKTLAAYPHPVRERIILTALGSPDPDGRQIDGLGGGVSSLSKVAVVSRPGEGVAQDWKDGVSWADDLQRSKGEDGWDVVFRFGQVGVKEPSIDWNITCGNLSSAVALHALTHLLPPIPSSHAGPTYPVRILAANNGSIVTAHVPVQRTADGRVVPAERGNTVIGGVPGSAPGIRLETALKTDGGVLLTGRARDVMEVDGHRIPFTFISTGLPNILVPTSSLPLPLSFSDLTSHPATLDSNTPLMSLLERLRHTAAQSHGPTFSTFSPGGPKIILVSPLDPAGYETTSAGQFVRSGDAEVVVRAVSVGNIHRSVPGTTLSAVAAAAAIPGTVVHEVLPPERDEKRFRVAHPAGTAEARATVEDVRSGEGEAGTGVVVRGIESVRTARLIMDGAVSVPEEVFE